jgi:hypothetical protein
VRHGINDDDITIAVDPTDGTPITVTQPYDVGTPFEWGCPGMARERFGGERSGPCQQRAAVSAGHRCHLFRRCGRHDDLHV